MGGQLMYLMASMVVAGLHAYSLFRLRSASTYYDAGKILSTNYWSLAGLVFDWGGLGLVGLVFLTQLMAIFGLFTSLNLFMWTVFLGSIGTLYQMTIAVLYFLAYDGAYSKA